MSSRTIPGQTCRACRTELTAASASCPSCGKLDMSRFRADLTRSVLPTAKVTAIIFGLLAVYTAYVNGPAMFSELASHIDQQFNPPAIKKK